MSINLNIKINFIEIFYLFRVSLINFTLILIDIFVNYNTKINLIEFFRLLCVNNFLFNNNVNLFYNVDNNFLFYNEIFL